MPHLSQETPMSLPPVEDDVCVSLMLTQGSCSSNTLTRMFWKSSTPCLGLSYHGETSWLQARTLERSDCMTWPEESHSMPGHTRRECPSTQWPSKMTTPATCLQPAMTAQSTCGTLANHLHLSLKMSTLPTSWGCSVQARGSISTAWLTSNSPDGSWSDAPMDCLGAKFQILVNQCQLPGVLWLSSSKKYLILKSNIRLFLQDSGKSYQQFPVSLHWQCLQPWKQPCGGQENQPRQDHCLQTSFRGGKGPTVHWGGGSGRAGLEEDREFLHEHWLLCGEWNAGMRRW